MNAHVEVPNTIFAASQGCITCLVDIRMGVLIILFMLLADNCAAWVLQTKI
jgi:hypothetical protein